MEDIILFGTGAGLITALEYLKRLDGFNVIEVWDNSESKVGNEILIGKDIIYVRKPHMINDIPIVITAVDYHDEISKGLVSLGIEYGIIKRRNYIFHSIEEGILNKYHNSDDDEMQKALSWIRHNGLDIFNGDWTKRELDIPECYLDDNNGLYYVVWNEKRMYLKREYDTQYKAKEYIRSILLEQVPESPHYYNPKICPISESDVVLDCGAAEGFFALDCIDIARSVVLVEMDEGWIEALEATFGPYKDKVVIIRKLLGTKETDDETTLETIIKQYPITYIKMDIEGYETVTLNSASRQALKNIRCIKACAYHKENDCDELRSILNTQGYETRVSPGYMFFAYEEVICPDLRRGIVLATRGE